MRGKPPIYEIKGNFSEKQISEINAINTKSKIQDRLKQIMNLGGNLIFQKIENEIFSANLQMIDSAFPLVLSHFLIQYYLGKGKILKDLTKSLYSFKSLIAVLSPTPLTPGILSEASPAKAL